MEHKFDQIDQLIKQKEFEELSKTERLLIVEAVGDKEAFDRLKRLIYQSQLNSRVSPKINVKKALVKQMQHRHENWLITTLSFKTPAYLNFILIIAILFFTWFFLPTEQVIIEKPVVVEIPAESDTVFVVSTPDTVYIDKYIRIEVPVLAVSDDKELTDDRPIQGSTLAEQKEVWELVGSSD